MSSDLRFEGALAFGQQHQLGIALAGGGDQDAAVGMCAVARQVMRRNVLALAGSHVVGDAVQVVLGDVVLPDAPGRLLEVGLALDQRSTHREHQKLAVRRDVQVLDVVEIGTGHTRRDVGLGATLCSLGAYVDVGLAPVMAVVAQVILAAHDRKIRRIGGQHALDVGDAEVGGGGAGPLAVTDLDGASLVAAGGQHQYRQQAGTADEIHGSLRIAPANAAQTPILPTSSRLHGPQMRFLATSWGARHPRVQHAQVEDRAGGCRDPVRRSGIGA